MKLRFFLTIIFSFFCLSVQAQEFYRIGIKKGKSSAQNTSPLNESNSETLFAESVSHFDHSVKLQSIPYILPEGAPASEDIYEEWIIQKTEQNAGQIDSILGKFSIQNTSVNSQAYEVKTILKNGPKENRICLTFLGDGYTLHEKQKFYDDVQRLTKGLFEGKTFSSYLPLFNVYAVFTPSEDSGITDIEKKNTAFKLYRSPAGSKRAIMPGDQNALERAIQKAPKTDFPIVIANDDFYGGLGGRYAITTRSETSGMIVLRHELGHNFGNVGEEYDNGYVYSGANSTLNPTNPPWMHWQNGVSSKPQEMRIISGDYVWQNLENRSYKKEFIVPESENGMPFFIDGRISFVGWASKSDVEIRVNGKTIEPQGNYSLDRGFLELSKTNDLPPGNHVLEIEEKIHDKDNVLAFATLFAYPPTYDFSSQIGAYATFDANGKKSYRPTHESCLMRNMLAENFCSVDQENMWLKFFKRVQLIDKITVKPEVRLITLETPKLNGIKTKWFAITKSQNRKTEIPGTLNAKAIRAPLGIQEIELEIRFESDEIKKQGADFNIKRKIWVENNDDFSERKPL
jgi:hypothetical protein